MLAHFTALVFCIYSSKLESKGNDSLWRCTLGVHLFLKQKQVRSHAHLLLPSVCVRSRNRRILCFLPFPFCFWYGRSFILVFIRLPPSLKSGPTKSGSCIGKYLSLYQKVLFKHCNSASEPNPISIQLKISYKWIAATACRRQNLFFRPMSPVVIRHLHMWLQRKKP